MEVTQKGVHSGAKNQPSGVQVNAAEPAMRVLMVATHLAGRGGVASVLRTWRDHGLFARNGVRFVPTNVDGSALAKALRALLAWARCALVMALGGVDLVHVHTSSYASFWRKSPILATALILRRPLIVSLHGGGFREFYAARGALGRAWIRLVMRRARRFVVLTSSWQKWVEEVEPSARVCVIPNPVPELAAQTPMLFSPTPVALFLGRVEREKGVDVLIEAIAFARRRGANWCLVCAGTGHIERMRLYAKELGLLESDVRFVGWVDGEAKRQLLENCSVLVLPSLIENMPVVILEAFAHGRPVIASRVGGIPDIVADGTDGLLVEAGSSEQLSDALVNCYEQPALLQAMGTRARSKAEREYAPDLVLASVEVLYRECIEPPA